MRILNTADVEALLPTLSPESILTSQSRVFALFSSPTSTSTSSTSTLPVHAAGQVNTVQQPPRLATFSPEGRTLYMPSYVQGLGTGCKILTRTASGMKTNMMLLAPEGGVEAVVECKRLTGVRNAAGSALFIRAIGANPRRMVVFGGGDQARAHLSLFKRLWPRVHRTVVLRREPAVPIPHALAEVIIISHNARGVSYVPQVLKQADVVVTATPATTPLFDTSALKPGAAVVLLGSSRPDMCEAPLDLMRSARVIVDSREACLRDAGEVIQAGLKGEDLTELGTLLAETEGGDGAKAGEGGDGSGEGRGTREGAEGRHTVFKSVGLGMQDLAINRLVLEKAEEMGVGTVV